jgi:hypothetical protein
MRKNLILSVLMLFFVSVFAGQGICIPPEVSAEDRPPKKEQREKLRQRIESIKMWKLTQTLDLDEKTAARLFPLMNRYDKKRAEVQHDIRKNIRDLKKTLQIHDEHRLSAVMKNLETYHGKIKDIEEQEWSDLKNILSVEQQAKLILFKMNFEREIRKMIAKTKKRRSENFERGERSFPPDSP